MSAPAFFRSESFETRTTSHRSRLIPMLVCGVLALTGFISRRPDQWFAPQFWAEDGKIFFFDAATLGWRALFQMQVGYLLLAGRAIASLASSLPWEFLPVIYAVTTALVSAAVVVRVAFSELPLLPRWLGAIALVAVPHSGEVFLTLTNVHWILAALLIVNLLEEAPTTRASAIRRAGEILLAGLSGPVALCLAPFALGWAWQERRERTCRLLIGAWAVTIAIQGSLWLTGTRATALEPGALVSAPLWLGPRYAAALFVGSWMNYTALLGASVAAVSLGIFGVLLFDRANSHRGRAAMLLAVAVVLLVAGRAAGGWWPNPTGGAARYAYLPLACTMWALAWLAAGTRSAGRRTAALALFACGVLSATSAWQARALPRFNWPQQVREVRAGSRARFEIPPDWSFPVPGSTHASVLVGDNREGK